MSAHRCKQQNSLQPSVVSDSASRNPLLLSTFQITHVLMKRNILRRCVCNQTVCQHVEDRSQFAAWQKACY